MMAGSELLDAEGITKVFPSGIALDAAWLRVGHGEVHALIGQNGAGKSTLIKILTGVYQRNAGTIRFDGKEISFSNPQHAQASGISTIYQEVNLIPLRSVAENIFLGREPRRWGLLDWRQMNSEASRLLTGLGVEIDVREPLGNFNIAIQQMTAIARAVSCNSKLVIMDEPTSSLDDREVETLFGVIRRLKSQGTSVVFVSHRLDELYAICDRVTIMRDGKTVGAMPMASVSKIELVSKMLGKEAEVVSHTRKRMETGASREPLLDARDLRHGRRLNGVTLSVGKGEIVGLAGLLGAGRTETARAVFGADVADSGKISFEGTAARYRTPADAIAAGMGFCSEDRKAEGIFPDMSVRENMTLALLPKLATAGVISRARQQEIVDRFIERLGIKTAGSEQRISELSGGNQQKVLLARWLCRNPKLLILDEPTRGIDVGAKGEIKALISELAAQGLGVIFISSDLDELIEESDRVVVLRDGKTVRTLLGVECTQPEILHAMAHGDAEPAAQKELTRAEH